MYSIIVKFDLEGYHRWPNAPEEYKMLRSKHNHNFRFEAEIPVDEDITNASGRALEILDVRRTLECSVVNEYGDKTPYEVGVFLKWEPHVCNFRALSCELLAESLAKTIRELYYVDPIKVVVMEDEFVGASFVPDVLNNREVEALKKSAIELIGGR